MSVTNYTLNDTTCEHCSSRMNPDNSEDVASCKVCEQQLHAECMASYDQESKEFICEHCNDVLKAKLEQEQQGRDNLLILLDRKIASDGVQMEHDHDDGEHGWENDEPW